MKSGVELVEDLGETRLKSKSESDSGFKSKMSPVREIGKSRISRPTPDEVSFSLDSLDPREAVGEFRADMPARPPRRATGHQKSEN